jgi:predicted DNA-binding protein (UPF0251 family)
MGIEDKINKYLEEKRPYMDPGEAGEFAGRGDRREEEKACPLCGGTKKHEKSCMNRGVKLSQKKEKNESKETPNLDMIFESGLSVAEIAKKEGISRQFVHRALKSAAGKLYDAMAKATGESPFKVLISIAVALNLESQEDFNDLKKLMPSNILKAVEDDAKNYLRK